MEERDEMATKRSRKGYLPIYLMNFVLLLTIILIITSGRPLSKLATGGAIIFIISSSMAIETHRSKDIYRVNSDFLIHIHGYFAKNTRKIPLITISDISVEQNVWQKLLGYGNIIIHIYSEGYNLKIIHISKPDIFGRFLEKKVNDKMSR